MITTRKTQGLTHLLPLGRFDLIRVLEAMLDSLGLEDCSLDLELANDARMAELNLEFLGCPGPTNILSFPSNITLEADLEPLSDEDFPALEAAPLEDYQDQGLDDSDDDDEEEDQEHLGLLVLAPETVRREAFLYGQPLDAHTLRLLAHGLVHLAGHDHGPLMDTLTEQALAAGMLAL